MRPCDDKDELGTLHVVLSSVPDCDLYLGGGVFDTPSYAQHLLLALHTVITLGVSR